MSMHAGALIIPLLPVHRELHKIPELAFEEDRTAAYIRAQLKELSIPFQTFDQPEGAKTGTVATLGSGEPRFVLRSDIDALPIKVGHPRDIEGNQFQFPLGHLAPCTSCCRLRPSPAHLPGWGFWR